MTQALWWLYLVCEKEETFQVFSGKTADKNKEAPCRVSAHTWASFYAFSLHKTPIVQSGKPRQPPRAPQPPPPGSQVHALTPTPGQSLPAKPPQGCAEGLRPSPHSVDVCGDRLVTAATGTAQGGGGGSPRLHLLPPVQARPSSLHSGEQAESRPPGLPSTVFWADIYLDCPPTALMNPKQLMREEELLAGPLQHRAAGRHPHSQQGRQAGGAQVSSLMSMSSASVTATFQMPGLCLCPCPRRETRSGTRPSMGRHLPPFQASCPGCRQTLTLGLPSGPQWVYLHEEASVLGTASTGQPRAPGPAIPKTYARCP